ncbi:MAG TPA: ABC transporter permease [Gemmatimonadales bacterium]|nr:ABC transporter permease [Gemmatimonadales bacterium]
MHKLAAIIRREFLARVRTRAFMISTLLGPLFFAAMFVIPVMIFGKESGKIDLIVLDAASGDLGQHVSDAITQINVDKGDTAKTVYDVTRGAAPISRLSVVQDSLIKLVDVAGTGGPRFDGILIVTDSAFGAARFDYLGSNVSSIQDMEKLQGILRGVVIREHLVRSGVSPQSAKLAELNFDLNTVKITHGSLTGESGEMAFMVGYVMSFILYFSILISGVQIMSAVVEEKSTRIMEVLVSSVRPFDLLLGKVVGVGGAVLLQLAIWAGSATTLSVFRGRIAGSLGMPAKQAANITMPTITPEMLLVLLAFFFLGFFLFASAYAAVGSMCNSTQETQQFAQPLTILVIIGFFGALSAIKRPDGPAAHLMSYIPLTAPFVVPVRFAISPLPWPEVVGSMLITLAGGLAVVWIAGRIYRIGVLAYGKRPTPREIFRWIRAG